MCVYLRPIDTDPFGEKSEKCGGRERELGFLLKVLILVWFLMVVVYGERTTGGLCLWRCLLDYYPSCFLFRERKIV